MYSYEIYIATHHINSDTLVHTSKGVYQFRYFLPNTHTGSYCCLLMHVCISIEMSLNVYVQQVLVYTIRLFKIEMHTCMSRQQ